MKGKSPGEFITTSAGKREQNVLPRMTPRLIGGGIARNSK